MQDDSIHLLSPHPNNIPDLLLEALNVFLENVDLLVQRLLLLETPLDIVLLLLNLLFQTVIAQLENAVFRRVLLLGFLLGPHFAVVHLLDRV